MTPEQLTALQPARRRLRGDDIAPAIDLIDATDMAGDLASRVTARRRGPAGRRATLPVRALLVGMLVDAVEHGSVLLTRVTELLYQRLKPAARRRLELADTDKPASFEAGYARVRRRLHAVLGLFDDSPYPHNRRLATAEFERRTVPLTPDEAAARKALRLDVGNRLLAASLDGFAGFYRGIAIGSCVDATAVATNARPGSKRRGICSADPDAGHYRRDYRDTSSTTPSGTTATSGTTAKNGAAPRKELYGYEATLHLYAPLDAAPRGGPAPPALVAAFAVERPGERPGAAAVDAITASAAHGFPTGLLAGDRAYNNSRPADYQLPVRALGFEPLFDYRDDQLGIQAGHHGALQIEGRWYCPHAPQALVDATIDHRADRVDEQGFTDRLEARRDFELRPKQNPRADGSQRMLCPAAGAAPTLCCPRKPASMGDPSRITIDPKPEPTGPPQVCRQDSITITAEAGAKHAQARPYRTPEWAVAYHKLRSSIEGYNGYAKDPTVANLEDARQRRVRGIAAQHFLLAFQLAAVNLRKIARWRAHTARLASAA